MIQEDKLWAVFRHNGNIDIVPTNDDKEHVAGKECGCNPKVKLENNCVVCVHNAYDFREVKEQIDDIVKELNA